MTFAGKENAMWGVELFVIGSMIVINALFAAYEIALASLSVSRLHVLIRERPETSSPTS